jgi:hypothetical protein
METAFMTSWWSSLSTATDPSMSSVTCLNCMVSSSVLVRVVDRGGFDLEAHI